MFTEEEIARLGSPTTPPVAAGAADGQLSVDAVGFQSDAGRFYVGGLELPRSRKYRDFAAGNRPVAPIVDDLASVDPWTPRGTKAHGTAEYFAITPVTTWSWGIVAPAFGANRFAPHRIAWTTG